MAQQFHIGSKGAAPCNAQPGKCPLGGDHFDSEREAEKAYESQMEEQGHSDQVISKKMSLSELAQAAKTTDDPKMIDKILESNGKRATGNLVNNPNLSREQVDKLLEQRPDLEKRLKDHPNLHFSKWDRERFNGYGQSSKLPDNLTEEELDVIKDRCGGRLPFSAQRQINESTNVSSEYRTNHLIEQGSYQPVLNALRNNAEFDQHKVVKTFGRVDLAWVSREVTDRNAALEISDYNTEDTSETSMRNYIAGNDKLDSDTLNAIYERHQEEYDTNKAGMLLYRNPNTPDKVKARLRENNESAKSYGKIEDLAESGKLREVFSTGGQSPRAFGSQRETYRFDPQKIKEAGLGPRDVDTYIRSYNGNYLFGASYNPETGIYTGYID